MPIIKKEKRSFLSSRAGEAVTVGITGAIFFTLITTVLGAAARFVSTTVYPFSYPFLHSPLHAFVPRIAITPPFPTTPIFASLFTLGIYYFEKNIFYRRFHLALKAAFASIAACVLVFVSSLLYILSNTAGIGFVKIFLYRADVNELPALFIYYYLTSLPVFFICGQIRRKIFALP